MPGCQAHQKRAPLHLVELADKRPQLADEGVPVTGTPVTLPSCPTIMITAMPARYPTRIGADNTSATNPSRSAQPATASTPTTMAKAAASAA